MKIRIQNIDLATEKVCFSTFRCSNNSRGDEKYAIFCIEYSSFDLISGNTLQPHSPKYTYSLPLQSGNVDKNPALRWRSNHVQNKTTAGKRWMVAS